MGKKKSARTPAPKAAEPKPASAVQSERDRLIARVSDLRSSSTLALVAMYKMHGDDGTPLEALYADADDYPMLGSGGFVPWPISDFRELWEASVPLVPNATFHPNDVDGGFTQWLWTESQKYWTLERTTALAVDPFLRWWNGLSDPPKTMWKLVTPKPWEATALEVAEVGKWASHLASEDVDERIYAALGMSEKRYFELFQERDTLRGVPPSGTKAQDWGNRRLQADEEWMRLKVEIRKNYCAWKYGGLHHEVINSYVCDMIPGLAVDRPDRMEFRLMRHHLKRVHVELTNHANRMKRESIVPRSTVERHVLAGKGSESLDTLAVEFEQLTGLRYPPVTRDQWDRVLCQSGATQEELPKFYRALGLGGYEDAGDIPPRYLPVHVPKHNETPPTPKEFYDRFGEPIFMDALMTRLRQKKGKAGPELIPTPEDESNIEQFVRANDIDWLLTARMRDTDPKVRHRSDRRQDTPPVDTVDDVLRRLPEKKSRNILIAMDDLNATPTGVIYSAERIAKKAIDPRSGSESIKDEMISLKNMGLVDSRKGRSGGSKLTDLGLKVAQKLKSGGNGSTK